MKLNNKQRGSVDLGEICFFTIMGSLVALFVIAVVGMISDDSHEQLMYIVHKEDGYRANKWKVLYGDIDVDKGDENKYGDEEVSFVTGDTRMVIKGYVILTKPRSKEREKAVNFETVGGSDEDTPKHTVEIYPVKERKKD